MNMKPSPGQLQRHTSRAQHLPETAILLSTLEECRICPRDCGVNRIEGETGYCGTGELARVSSAFSHYGEEPPLVGWHGSGTIFFSGCNLRCAFCQNYDISHRPESGEPMDEDGIAGVMLSLQERGCHNINFVTPTHVAPQIAAAVLAARDRGLSVPTVYNCGGYEKKETLKALDGIMDIYMPDAKFFDPVASERYFNAPDYPGILKEALLEMHRQVGTLEVEHGIARRGVLVRHLVMPGFKEDSLEVVEWIAGNLGEGTTMNVMEQYRPVYEAGKFPEINKRPDMEDWKEVRDRAAALGLNVL